MHKRILEAGLNINRSKLRFKQQIIGHVSPFFLLLIPDP
jgi:hypothetical protein